MKTSENISKIAPALVEAQKKMGNAVKGSENPFFKSKYADLNSIREACVPILNDCGISVLQPTVIIDGKPFVNTLFLHESGEFISGQTEIIASKHNDAQSHGSGVSYARRYGLQSLANIGADDDDGNKAQPTPEKEPTKTEIKNNEIVKKTLGAADSQTIQKVVDWANKNELTITGIEKYYTMSKVTKEKIEKQLNK